MTDQEIDKWVEEHVVVPDDVSEAKKPLYDDIVPAITQWGKLVAKKFYKLGKDEKKTIKGLTCRDLKKIHKIVEAMLKEKKEVYVEGQIIYGVIYPAFRASEKAFYTEVLRRLKGNGMDEN